MTAILEDAHGVRVVVPDAYPVPALRPVAFQWCLACGRTCGVIGHQIVTFTASEETPEGWVYRSPEAWTTPKAPAWAALVEWLRPDGALDAVEPWAKPVTATTERNGRVYDLWCRSSVDRRIQYRERA